MADLIFLTERQRASPKKRKKNSHHHLSGGGERGSHKMLEIGLGKEVGEKVYSRKKGKSGWHLDDFDRGGKIF